MRAEVPLAFWSRLSIAVKVPIILGLLLLVALGAMATTAYMEMRREVIAIASARLEQASAQIASVFTNSVRQRVLLQQPLLRSPEVINYLKAPDAAATEAARAAILKYLGPAADAASVDVLDTSGRRLMVVGAPAAEFPPERVSELITAYQSQRLPTYGHMWQQGEGLANPVGGPVIEAVVPLGYLVERRRGANSRQTASLLTGLIGEGATILIGNDDGSAWTDLDGIASSPPVSVSDPEALLSYQRDGQPAVFARAARISGAPWVVVIEFPSALVLAPAHRVLVRGSVAAGVLVLLSVIAGWAMSRRITTPLRQVTEAAEAVANSQPKVHVDFDRQDELGRLASSFNTMAEQVELGRLELEHRVEERTAELQAANKELEAFSYSVSHDLRAPVRAISGFVQILEEDHANKLDVDGLRSLDVIKRNTRRMGQLIDDLLSFAQLGRAKLSPIRFDMAALVQGIVDDAKRASEFQRAQVLIGELPPAIGESSLIGQVWVNLVQNALKFSSERDRPLVTIGSVPGTQRETVYFIRDNGVGFDMRHAVKLFGVFERLHKAEEFPGTGVGLAIVQRVIERHGGRVWAEGAVGEGATFYFSLPSDLARDAAKAPAVATVAG
jgi:signal transduction histidine kinase